MVARQSLYQVQLEGVSDPGRTRPHNEDYWGATADALAFAVADGVGGRRNGDVASRTAVETFLAAIERGGADPESLIRSAVAEANAALTWSMPTQGSMGDMSTTLVGALIQGDQLYVANVGDSRAYLLRGNQMQQITRDHTLSAEEAAARSPELEAISRRYSHVITRSLGKGSSAEPDVHNVTLLPGDRILLCTDGLSRQVDDETIRRLASRGPIRKAVQDLVDRANAAGGKDNVTVVLAEVELAPSGRTEPMPAVGAAGSARTGTAADPGATVRLPTSPSAAGTAGGARSSVGTPPPPTTGTGQRGVPSGTSAAAYFTQRPNARGLRLNPALIGGIVGAIVLLCVMFGVGFAAGRLTAPNTGASPVSTGQPASTVVPGPAGQPTGVPQTPVVAASPGAGATPGAATGVTPTSGLRTDFRGTAGGFERQSGEQEATADGYIMRAPAGGVTWALLPNQTYRDFTAEIECRLNRPTDDGTCGFVFHATADSSNWYKVAINPKTQQMVVNSLVRDVRKDLFTRAGITAIQTGTNPNTIRVVASGSTFTFSVNGTEVTTVSDDTFSSGLVGLIANGLNAPVEVRFTRFELTPR